MVETLHLATLVGAALVAVGIVTSLLSLRFGAPLLLVFLVLGLTAGEDGVGRIDFDDAPVAFAVCSIALAIVLFDSGAQTPWSSLRIGVRPAVWLATVGVVVSAGVVGLAAFALGFGLLEGMLLGAIVASTDAAAVFFLLRGGGAVVRDRVRATLEIESGGNDPMAILLTAALIGVLAGDGQATPVMLAVKLVAELGLGLLIGAAGGWAIARVLARLPLERVLAGLLALALALCLFAATTMLGGSGYLAVYVAGLVFGNARALPREAFRDTASAFTWLAQIAMFLVLGLLATPSRFLDVLGVALALSAVLMFVARPLAVALCLLPAGFDRRETAFVGWVGLRGAVALLLAILPVLAGLPDAWRYFDIAFVIVLSSLLLQGWTLLPAARWLKQIVPARLGPVERKALDMPGLASHELVCYRILEHSPIAAGAALPRWSRPSLVVRDGETLRIQKAGPLRPNDLVYLIVPDERIALLDRIFASAREPDRSDRAFFGELSLAPDVTVGDLAASYGLPLDTREAGFTIAERLAREFDGTPTVGDRWRLGPVELIVRAVDDAGRVEEVGLTFARG